MACELAKNSSKVRDKWQRKFLACQFTLHLAAHPLIPRIYMPNGNRVSRVETRRTPWDSTKVRKQTEYGEGKSKGSSYLNSGSDECETSMKN